MAQPRSSALSQPEICLPPRSGSTVDVVFDLLYRVGRQSADDGCTDAQADAALKMLEIKPMTWCAWAKWSKYNLRRAARPD